jgi:adenylate cyclase
LTKAVELLQTLPATHGHAQQELALHITLGGPLRAIKGYSAPEVEKTYSRARELCHQDGEPAQLFSVLRGLFGVYMARGPLSTGRELAEQLLQIARREQDVSLVLQAHHALGMVLGALGEPALARSHLEQGITLYDPQQHHSVTLLFGLDPGVDSRSWLADALWYLGYPDQALQWIQEALTLASELPHHFNLVATFFHAAKLHYLRREDQLTRKWAEAAITIAAEYGFPLFLGWSKKYYGWALAEQGQEEEGIAQACQGSAVFDTTGAEVNRSNLLLAETYGKVGQPEQGLALLAETLTAINKTDEHWQEAELYRLKGKLTLQKELSVASSQFSVTNPQPLIPNPQAEAEAEGDFLKAIAIARKQQAKSWELRASTSLARLWQSQGKIHEAHSLLSEIYNWFTEGFDTKDLQEAKTLIEELTQ